MPQASRLDLQLLLAAGPHPPAMQQSQSVKKQERLLAAFHGSDFHLMALWKYQAYTPSLLDSCTTEARQENSSGPPSVIQKHNTSIENMAITEFKVLYSVH